MATPTLDALTAQVIAYFRSRYPTRDLGSESFLGKLAAATAMSIFGLYKATSDVTADAIPSSSTSSDRLDDFAYLFGLSNGSGGFGRKGAVAATGGLGPVTYTGTVPYTLAGGTGLTASDGVTQFEVSSDLTFAATGTQSCPFRAVTTGTAGNVAVGAVLTFSSTVSGLTPTVALSTATSGGTDQESDADLLARILDRLQNPPAGATAAQYRIWCNGQTGVEQTYVYPRRVGTGSVDMVITKAGTGSGRVPSVQTAVQTYIDSVRPVTVESANVRVPTMDPHKVRARVVPNTGYEFDLVDAGVTVSSYNSGTKELTLSANWAALDTAVNTQGKHPRIQIATTNGNLSGDNLSTQQVRVTAYNSSTHVATLDTAIVTPSAADPVYSGGPVVAQVSADIIAHCDSLGPSKASGYAYQGSTWSDTLAIEQLVRVCLDSTDTSASTKYCSNVVRSANVPQVFIDGASADVQASDNTTDPPSMLWIKTLVVTQ